MKKIRFIGLICGLVLIGLLVTGCDNKTFKNICQDCRLECPGADRTACVDDKCKCYNNATINNGFINSNLVEKVETKVDNQINSLTIGNKKDNLKEIEPKIENIGLDIGYYDETTNKAGDFVFTKSKIFQNKIFQDYGELITETSDGKPKINIQPTYLAPLGTKVRAITSGKIDKIELLYSGDYGIHIIKNYNSPWRYELEHVLNPVVKVGDMVVAGQIIAEVSNQTSEWNSGFGLVEIGILKGGNPPSHVCPYLYLDDSVKEDYYNKINAFYNSWEEYKGDSNIYDQDSYPLPGCISDKEMEG